MFDRTYKTVASLLLGFACLGSPVASRASIPAKLTGAIYGRVANPAGVPQMGATVVLFDRQDRVREKALTDDRGEFSFFGLLPDVYSIRVSLAAFIPAVRRDILVQPGMRSLLAVNLNTIFSSIQLAYPPLENGSFMSDDWKWMLRGSSSTRPLLRLVEQQRTTMRRGTLFSETRGLLRVSAGDGAPVTGIANEADMGTAFALATSIYGNNQLEVGGNLGYGSQTGVPMAAFRTSYARVGGGPKVSVNMRQLYVPGRSGAVAAGMEQPLPVLRSVAASFDDRTQVLDHLAVQYGLTVDSVTFLDHMHYFSPYARLSYSMEDGGEVAFAYTSGNARPDLASASAPDGELQRGLNTLAMLPRMSLLNGKSKIQRGEEYELTYRRKVDSREYEASVYREAVLNAALTMVAPDGMFGRNDVLSDMLSGNSTFNAGDYRSTGYRASVTQNVGESVSATLMFGSMGALSAGSRELVSNSPDELRRMIHRGRKRAATARVAATSPWTGTQIIASYQWSDGRWAMPGHLYSTQALRPMPGLNIYVRQPIPIPSSSPCRVEVTADLRNMLADGYLPLKGPNGQRVLLVETPRSVRGGVNLIF